MSMVRSISTGQLGCLSVCAPSQLLHTCLLAEYEKLEKVLDVIATTENISVINQHFYRTKSKPQQLLGGK